MRESDVVGEVDDSVRETANKQVGNSVSAGRSAAACNGRLRQAMRCQRVVAGPAVLIMTLVVGVLWYGFHQLFGVLFLILFAGPPIRAGALTVKAHHEGDQLAYLPIWLEAFLLVLGGLAALLSLTGVKLL